MSNLKTGKRVKLLGFVSKIPDKYNPKDIEGTVVSVTGDYNPYIVECDNEQRVMFEGKIIAMRDFETKRQKIKIINLTAK